MEAFRKRRSAAAGIDLALPRTKEAPAIARAAVAGLCEPVPLTASRCQTLLLLVSEVVTNAFVHSDAPAGTPIGFRVELAEEVVRIVVNDGGSGFVPRIRASTDTAAGWGLHLVQREAERWGVETQEGTSVWFELAVEVPAS